MSQLLSPEMSSEITERTPRTAESIDPKTLVRSVQEAFSLLEPWCNAQAKIKNRYVVKLIKRVKKNSIEYFKAINMSVQCTEYGIILCTDALELRQLVENSEPDGNHDIIQFISYMRKKAREALRDARRVVTAFRNVHEEMKILGTDLPKLEVKIKKEPAKYRQWGKGAKAVKDVLPKDCGISLATGVGAAFGIITLPIAIPLVVLAVNAIAGFVEERCNHKAEECELAMDETLAQVQGIGTTLKTIENGMNGFVDWWSDALKMLDDIEQNLNNNDVPRDEIFQIFHKWDNVKKNYEEYVYEVKKLQTFYPPEKPTWL
ncbi:hypothetical protein K435DRAFT_895878 [Dendrothele bispora CBS 962.96]|uniref:Uncharacterized protein n=1 Tax=Dendrothele bispora (strain CBS 962.96) TaxID=1314807 RepID=A0A4S8KN22_DENBC|nr:hypothetical protein K435DRAFT_895878 [Dendrothele bispora CBS 962.96]